MLHRIGLLIALAPLIGCTHYEYDITDPPDLAQHIGSDTWVDIPVSPLIYHFKTEDNYLVLRIENLGDIPAQLLGERSFVVSPDGQSHPLRSETIAPHSFIKMILPPIPPRVERVGPSIGVGFGYRASDEPPRRPQIGESGQDRPANPIALAIYFDDPPYFWHWDGEGIARLSLANQVMDRTIEHHFTLSRRKL